MDPSGDGGGLTATQLVCGSCGAQSNPTAKFCSECGMQLRQAAQSAEYKQVTVLFADVVHSMDIAAAVGAERLREIMTQLVGAAATVVQRFGGTVDKFTGDGIMAVFGAPVALEDHALRACLAALGVQEETARLAAEVKDRDCIDLRLRVGLNSGQVIAGAIGSGPFGYTAVGEQVGMAQRMESVAPPGGVMLSAATAGLVDGVAVLGEPELVQIKGAEQPVVARRLLGVSDRESPAAGAMSALVGRRWEMAAVEGLLERAIEGHGAVVTVVGSPGIGKSRLVREATRIAADQGVEVFTAHCESHTAQVPFHAVARLLRSATGIDHLDPEQARMRLRGLDSEADPEDVLLFEDLMGIRDPDIELPKIDPDARRRRLTALVNTASLGRESPAVYVIEDAHWIDEVSESMLADFFTVIPQTPSLVLVTYRPEYCGLLSQVGGSPSIALAPLSDPEIATLVGELVGREPSVDGLATLIVERAAGNPFFAQEMVRELAERGVLQRQPGGYVSTADVATVSLPATVQATIAARIDRLDAAAKRTLSAAAVIGSKFSRKLLESLGVDPALEDLVRGQFLDQISFTRHPDYVFHHPLIRTVAYESQLKSDRAELHRSLAAAIEVGTPASAEENAALIAEHLEAAGDLHAAYGWHMRAAAWATNRDITAARLGWEHAREIADALPADDPDQTRMRIAPRTMWCASVWRGPQQPVSPRFEELRQLCTDAGDKTSLAIALVGPISEHMLNGRLHEASRLATEQITLAESIDDPALRFSALFAAMSIRVQSGEVDEPLRWSQAALEWADGDFTKSDLFFGSPMALALVHRGVGRWWLGRPGWRKDLDEALALARNAHATTRALTFAWAYGLGITGGVLRAEDSVLGDLEQALQLAEAASDDNAVGTVKYVLTTALAHRNSPRDRERRPALLTEVRGMCLDRRFTMTELPVIELWIACDRAESGDLESAVPMMRQCLEDLFVQDRFVYVVSAVGVLVPKLLARANERDLVEAETAIDRLAAVTGNGWIARDIMVLRLRALLAHARGDDETYRDYRDRYRKMATDLGFEGHMQWAEEMR